VCLAEELGNVDQRRRDGNGSALKACLLYNTTFATYRATFTFMSTILSVACKIYWNRLVFSYICIINKLTVIHNLHDLNNSMLRRPTFYTLFCCSSEFRDLYVTCVTAYMPNQRPFHRRYQEM